MKVKHQLLCIALASLLTPTQIHALDLTPTAGFRELETMKIPVVFFEDGGRKVRWQPPGQWLISGGGTGLLISPPEASHTGMEFRVIPRKDAEVPDGKTDPKAAASWVQSLLPSDSEKITFVQEIPSPFLLGNLTSRELTFTYTYLAREFSTSVALVNLDLDHSLAVIIYAPTKDFQNIHEEGTKSMFRWVWLGTTPSKERANEREPASAAQGK
jgi:hypothetical protein